MLERTAITNLTVVSPLPADVWGCLRQMDLAPGALALRRRKYEIFAPNVHGLFRAKGCVVHQRKEGHQPWTARLLGRHGVQQCASLPMIDDASSVNELHRG